MTSRGKREEIEDNIINLNRLIKYYVENGKELMNLSEAEVNSHIDDMLDLINDFKKQLEDEH